MLEVDIKAGDVFTWKNYPYFVKEFKSQRWILYLGNQPFEAMIYSISATTQLHYYSQGGGRERNNHFELPVGMGGLEEKSIIDFKFFDIIPETDVNNCKTDIDKKGTFTQDYINKFVKHLKIDRFIPKIIKNDIYGYLRNAGFKVAN